MNELTRNLLLYQKIYLALNCIAQVLTTLLLFLNGVVASSFPTASIVNVGALGEDWLTFNNG